MAIRREYGVEPGTLWLSRPPFMLMARVVAVAREAGVARVAYVLLDDDGSALSEPIWEPLDDGWWRCFQPMVRRDG